jgi:hypothetical protein
MTGKTRPQNRPDRQNMTGKTGQTEQDRQNVTGRTGQAEQDRQSRNRTDRQNSTGKTEQLVRLSYVPFWLFFSSCLVLFWLSNPVRAILSCLSCYSSPVQGILFCLSHFACPLLSVLFKTLVFPLLGGFGL